MPRRDRAHRHWSEWRRRRQYRARQAHRRWNAYAQGVVPALALTGRRPGDLAVSGERGERGGGVLAAAALRELAVALGSGGRAADTAASPRLPLTQRLEETFAARAAELPAPARTLVRVAAAAEDGRLATVLTGAEIIDGAPRTIQDLMPLPCLPRQANCSAEAAS